MKNEHTSTIGDNSEKTSSNF